MLLAEVLASSIFLRKSFREAIESAEEGNDAGSQDGKISKILITELVLKLIGCRKTPQFRHASLV
jgi:hypothetical protein